MSTLLRASSGGGTAIVVAAAAQRQWRREGVGGEAPEWRAAKEKVSLRVVSIGRLRTRRGLGPQAGGWEAAC